MTDLPLGIVIWIFKNWFGGEAPEKFLSILEFSIEKMQLKMSLTSPVTDTLVPRGSYPRHGGLGPDRPAPCGPKCVSGGSGA